MNVKETDLEGVLVIEPRVFGDSRGFFLEQFNRLRYESGADSPPLLGAGEIVQLNHSHSMRNTLRGLHFQEPNAQGKLVWAVRGTAFDVAVDVRRGSPSFGHWTGMEISGDNHLQLWIPPGFAHGFSVLSDEADLMYACTDYYSPADEHSILWSDPDLAIDWRVGDPVLSPKDAAAPTLAAAPVLPAMPAV